MCHYVYFTASIPAKAGQGGAATVGQTFFTEKLFRDVILRDKDLVRTFQDGRRRAPLLGWILTALGVFIVSFLLLLVAVSLYKNKQLLAEAQERGEKVIAIVKEDSGNSPLNKTPVNAGREINATEDLRQTLVKFDEYNRNSPPLMMRFGMYTGDEIYKKNLLPIYINVIEQRFKRPTIARIEAELKKFNAAPPVGNVGNPTEEESKRLEKQYNLFTAYLMLTGEYKKKANAGLIANTLKEYWTAEAKLPAEYTQTAELQLDFWAKQVDRDEFPFITPDNELVAATRKKLLDFPARWGYYKRRVTEISKIVDDQYGAVTTEAILLRGSSDTTYVQGSYTVPGAYTVEGYPLMQAAIKEAPEKLSEGDWVVGDKTGKAQSNDEKEIEEKYLRDYADRWRDFVKGIKVRPYKNKEDAEKALSSFSSDSSPMKILLTEINRNTNLSEKAAGGGLWEWIKSFRKTTPVATGGGTQVEKDFRPLVAFAGNKEKAENPPVEKYKDTIGKVYTKFNGISDDKYKEIVQELATEKDTTLQLKTSETAVDNLLKSFNDSQSAQAVASLLQQPLGNLRELLGGGQNDQLKKVWADQIFGEAKKIEKGFPFEDSQAESDLNDLKTFLNPTDGKLSIFYKDRLSTYFEEVNGQLKVKASSKVQFSDEFVAYLNNAFNLRKTLFGTNPTPKFEYEFQLNSVKDAIIEVNIDGQTISSEGTASTKLSFPAATGTETGVIMKLASTSGTSSTSGTTLPSNSSANTSAANVNNTNASKFLQNSNVNSSNEPLKFTGNWGLFKFIDKGNPQKQPDGRYLLTYDVGGKKVTAFVKPSGGDLFDKTIFRSLKAPQNILK